MRSCIIALLFTLIIPFTVLGGDQTVPNGVQRVGAAPTSNTDRSYDTVNVAIVDTGIDTTHPDLNVAGGVDCSPKQESFFGNAITLITQDIKDDTNPFGPIELAPDAPGWQDGCSR